MTEARFPRRRGDRPMSGRVRVALQEVSQHTWVAGNTFEHLVELPVPYRSLME